MAGERPTSSGKTHWESAGPTGQLFGFAPALCGRTIPPGDYGSSPSDDPKIKKRVARRDSFFADRRRDVTCEMCRRRMKKQQT